MERKTCFKERRERSQEDSKRRVRNTEMQVERLKEKWRDMGQ